MVPLIAGEYPVLEVNAALPRPDTGLSPLMQVMAIVGPGHGVGVVAASHLAIERGNFPDITVVVSESALEKPILRIPYERDVTVHARPTLPQELFQAGYSERKIEPETNILSGYIAGGIK